MSVILALALIFGMVPFAFAAEDAPAAEKREDCIKWEVKFDKEKYFLFDRPTVKATFTNTGDKDLLAVFSAGSEAFEILSGKSESMRLLRAGESFSETLQLQLSSNAPKINFFARILLKIRDLFKKGSSFKAEGKAALSFEASADFGWDGRQPVSFYLDYSELEIADDAEGSDRGRKFFQEIFGKDAYTMKFVMSSTTDNQTSSMPVIVAKNGSKMYIEASAPIDIGKDAGSMTIKAYINGDKARIYTPEIKAYIDLPSDEVKEIMDEFKLGVEAPEKGIYKGTAKTSIGGKNFEVDVYENDTVTSYYFFDGENLCRIEHKDIDGTDSVIEINEVLYSADGKLFVEPSGYYNMTDLLSQEGMDDWF